MLPFETNELPEEDEEDIDPFAELNVVSRTPSKSGDEILTAFADDDDDDPLSAFTDDDETIMDEVVISFDDDDLPALEGSTASTTNTAEATYKLLLETVWVDDILDPSEVELLARKRSELGLSFERHLQLVRAIIGG
jgi:hypothetical protein|tara:strand:- start:1253 stop:1663 length:411 start_codon:yes stop_codon:yes gene_type:complete